MNEAELVFAQILNCGRPSLYLDKELNLDREHFGLISSVLKRRIAAEPVQYILGKTEFMGLKFKVNRDVFIPRPETEILAEEALKTIRSFVLAGTDSLRLTADNRSIKILELGTGSGCIAVSLAKFLQGFSPEAGSPTEEMITAVDISSRALETARENALLNNVNIHFLQSDLFSNSRLEPAAYDLILSNPPYIPSAEIAKLQLELSFEPLLALDGGWDGLDFYRRISAGAGKYLKKGGFLIVEIGFNQKKAVEEIFEEAGHFKAQEIVKDYSGIDRVMVLQ